MAWYWWRVTGWRSWRPAAALAVLIGLLGAVTLGALALQTSRIRLGTLMTASTFRHPGPLAITGFGMGMVFVPMFDVILAGVAPHQVGSASGLLESVQQLSMSLGDQAPRIPIASVFVRGLIFYSPWVVLAPAITLLGWYQRLGTGNLAWRVPVWIIAVVIACVVDPVIMTVLARLLGVRSPSSASPRPRCARPRRRSAP